MGIQAKITTGSHRGTVVKGTTTVVTSSRITFELDSPLELVGEASVDMKVDWPAMLDGVTQMILAIQGRIVGHRGCRVTVEIGRYEFRSRGNGVSSFDLAPNFRPQGDSRVVH